jgi:ubiquinone/menaquinone biosynthesis C-methylase UbiE
VCQRCAMELDEYRRMAAVEDVHWWYRSTRALLEQVLDPVLTPGGTYLDAGCGTGATGAWMGTHGRLVATDFEPLALSLYRERHADALGLARADVSRLPFASASFDAAVCVTVLFHQAIVSPVAAVAELARVVRPGGVVCLLEPGVRRLHRAHDRVTHAARRFSLAELRALLVHNGLAVERATGAYSFLVPVAAVKAMAERGHSASDLDRNQSGLGGTLSALASLERRLLRHASLPFGLSVLVVGRRLAEAHEGPSVAQNG